MFSKTKVKVYFDEVADTWDDNAEAPGPKHLMMAQLAGVKEGSRVLDVGCGTGIMVPAYLELGAAHVTAIDLSPRMIENAKKKFADIPEERVSFVCGDVNSLEDYDDFTNVVIYNCYPHIDDKLELVESVCDLLSDHGRFLVAHGMSRACMKKHHANVPKDVHTCPQPVDRALQDWERDFVVDTLADNELFYFFGGIKAGHKLGVHSI